MPPQTDQIKERVPGFQVLDASCAEFQITEYALAEAFSSFLPGMAGRLGIPLWAFYVNRGQALCAFGVENKDGAILEFESASKAYRDTALTGFRTFLRLGPQGTFYEPFQETQANQAYQRSTRMVISPYELRLEEVNRSLGLKTVVRYFGLPNRPLAALCREVTLENLGSAPLQVEVLDGLPEVAPYGLGDLPRKTMARTMEAWSFAEGLDEGLPYLRQRCSSQDSVEIVPVVEGHFFAGMVQGRGRMRAIVDPCAVFGRTTGLDHPTEYAAGRLGSVQQRVENRTPCAFLHGSFLLAPEAPLDLQTLYGRANSLEQARRCVQELEQPGAFKGWHADNRDLVLEVAHTGWISSGLPALDGYALQTFLDNALRGGVPVGLNDGARGAVLNLYSRKHGDLERDYNAFNLAPSPFSQGNGAFRDICQNRRNDLWTHPDVGDATLRYFSNLLQLDGNNPLLIQGLEYRWEGGEEGARRLGTLLPAPEVEALVQSLAKPFTPRRLWEFCRARGLERPGLLEELTAAVLVRSKALEKAESGEGYWVDHGFYLTDLLERFEALYPDRMALLLADESFTYFDNALVVAKRADKLKKTAQGWRQYGSVVLDREKAALIQARSEEPRRARTKGGQGEPLRTSLWAKLLCFTANKFAGLDARGAGLEMDAEKPGWNDSLNGLPGLFGSSTHESLALKRLLLNLSRWLVEQPTEVTLPMELAAFLRGLARAPWDPFAFWVEAGRLKESYREATRLGVDGAMTELDADEIRGFLEGALERLDRGLALARRPDGLFHSYFINVPQVDESGPRARVTGFESKELPLFLEGQVHALRLAAPSQAAALARAAEASDLFDPFLRMFKCNAPLAGAPQELGRIMAFTPGWLENESIFMHMEFKYLLELLKAGLAEDFYRHFRKACPAFMDPARYGRSVFENSSFIASGANPDPSVHGRGFVARLSGTTCEFQDIILNLALGTRPFAMRQGHLVFEPRPLLHGSLFKAAACGVELRRARGKSKLSLEAGTFALRCFGDTVLVLHAPAGAASDALCGPAVERITLGEGPGRLLRGSFLEEDDALLLRSGEFERVDLWLAESPKA